MVGVKQLLTSVLSKRLVLKKEAPGFLIHQIVILNPTLQRYLTVKARNLLLFITRNKHVAIVRYSKKTQGYFNHCHNGKSAMSLLI